MGQYFTFEGRVRRLAVWVNGILNLLIYLIIFAIFSNADGGFAVVIGLALYIVLTIRALSISVRRWHDLDKSGAWVLINLVPIVGALYSFVMLGFISGNQSANQYGPAPEEGVIF